MNVSVIFSIILSVIVIVLILTLGADQLLRVVGLSNAALTAKAVEDLRATANRVYDLGEGSSLKFSLSLPGSVRFCFVNPDSPGPARYPNPAKNWLPDPVVQNIIREQGFSLWVTSEGEENGYRIEHLRPAENFCAKTGTTLFLENQGLFVDIAE